MKRKQQKRQSWALLRLVDILNWVEGESPALRSRKNDPLILFDPPWDSKAEIWRDKLKAVRDEIREDVGTLLDPPPRPSDAELFPNATPAEFWLRTVIDKIDADGFNPFFSIERYTNGSPANRSPLRIGKEQFVIQSGPIPSHDARKHAYWILGEVLESGEFSMLRRCPNCSRFFVTTRSNRQTCTRECSTAHQNRTRWETGKIQKWRNLKKERARRRR